MSFQLTTTLRFNVYDVQPIAPHVPIAHPNPNPNPNFPSQQQLEKDLFSRIRGKRATLVCGAGVAMAICAQNLTWSELINRYIVEVGKLLGTNQNWLNNALNHQNPLQFAVNYANTTFNDMEFHRLVAQRIFVNIPVLFPDFAQILHRMECLITTTNYDLLLEQSIPNRFGISHVDILKYNMLNSLFSGGPNLGVGPYLSSPFKSFIVHVHGRYFDVGDEHGFCLTDAEYVNPQSMTAFLDFMLPMALETSLVFIGARGTVFDAHFRELWVRVAANNGTKSHYIICTNGDVDAIYHELAAAHVANVFAVGLGNTRDDVWQCLAAAFP